MTSKLIPSDRLCSLDTLRGFDMFWIIGGDILFRTLGSTVSWPWAKFWGEQMEHVPWEGFHAYDLVFPLFMFISGVTIPFAILKKLSLGESKSHIYARILKRVLLLILLGLVYNGFLEFSFQNMRVASVLGQIGLTYLIASIIVINTNSFRSRLIWLICILAGYSIIQLIIPVPGFGAGVLTQEGSINGYIDRLLLPGRLYGSTFDPEGILCIVSASATTLMGSLAGEVLKSQQFQQSAKFFYLIITGVLLVIIGFYLGQFYPIIKSVWTTTFTLLAGGISFILLAIFYLVIDLWKINRWTFVFRVIGLNSITIYMATCMVDFRATSDFVFSGAASFAGVYEPIALIVGMIAVEWLFLYFLYNKSVFLKV